MDYKDLLARTQTKMAEFLDRRTSELIDTEFRDELEALAEKICFQNLVNQYRRRKLAIPISLEQRLNYEATQRRTAKIERRTSATTEGSLGRVLPQTQRIAQDSRNRSD